MTQSNSVQRVVQCAARAVAGAGARYRHNLATGLKLALMLPARGVDLHATLGQLIALSATLATLSAIDDIIAVGLPAQFSAWGLLSWAAISYFWLATLAVIVIIMRPAAGGYLLVAVAMASVLVIQFVVWSAAKQLSNAFSIDAFDTYYLFIWSAFLSWEALAFIRVLGTVLGVRVRPAVATAMLYGGAVYASLTLLPHSAMFTERWQPSKAASPDVESTYYAQPNLLAQSLYTLAPQRPGKVDLYFVGFAAYADQDVFQREIEQATVIFEQRYDAIGRTLNLINNPSTLQTVPLANRHNLDRAIDGLAERIDRREDIVVLFLSSHGDDDATIAVDLDGFRLNDLSAGDVREILDTHEIEWRIVIVSACYSGSFIEALSSPRTLVITAAASDRSSFGCAHENEWTYFGEAFFGHALKQSTSLVGAFELAVQRITQREVEEGKEASLPQISLGDEIAAYLEAHSL